MPDQAQTENPKLKEARERWREVRECEFEKKIRDLSDLKYFTGEDQGWDEDGARAKLKEEDRPALTLNRVQPIIRLIAGTRPKTEESYTPVEDGDVVTAEVFNACSDHVDRFNKWQFLADEAFLKMLVHKAVVFGIEPNYDLDPMGEIELPMYSRDEFWLDPDSKRKDRFDANYLFYAPKVTPDEAKRMFPKKKAVIENLVGHVEGSTPSGATGRDSAEADEYQDPQAGYYDTESKKITIVYYWYKEHERVTRLIDLATGDVMDSPMDKDEAEEKLKGLIGGERFKVVESNFTRVKYLTFCHDIVLDEGITPWERQDGQKTVLSEQFPFVVFELERIHVGTRQELVSLIESLKDPQRFYNKLSSAVLHIIGTTANSGWEYEKGAISDENKETLKNFGSKPGVNIEWEDGAISGQKARKITPTAPPVGQIEYADRMASALLDVSGVESLVSTESLGKGASGRAIDLKQRQGGNIISWVYDTWDFYAYILAEYKRDAIQTLFDYEKVVRIKGARNRQVVINETVYDEMGGIVQILNDTTGGKFDVAIQRKEALPTIRLERFRYFSELVKGGALPLPPPVMMKVVMHLMDDPELRDLVEQEFGSFMSQQQGAMGAPGGPPQLPGPQQQMAA